MDWIMFIAELIEYVIARLIRRDPKPAGDVRFVWDLQQQTWRWITKDDIEAQKNDSDWRFTSRIFSIISSHIIAIISWIIFNIFILYLVWKFMQM